MIVRTIILIHVLLSLGFSSLAQYGNEWINYDKTHYKFPVVKDGLVRIPFDAFITSGINAAEIVGANIRVFGRGAQVPLYVTSSGQFSSGDYVEFYGQRNDGWLDTELYRNPDHQPHTNKSLFNDTAVYFLTFDNTTAGLFIEEEVNDVSSPPSKEEYFMHYTANIYSRFYNEGAPASSAYPTIHDSEYTAGEGLVNSPINGSFSTEVRTSQIYLGAAAPDPVLNYTVVTNFNSFANQFHEMDIKISDVVDNFQFNGAGVVRRTIDLEVDDLIEGNTPVSFEDVSNRGVFYLALVGCTYPQRFSFDNFSTFGFGIEKSSNIYLEIENFNDRSTTPLLYDLNNLKRFEAEELSGIYKFNLPATSNNKDDLFMSSQDAADITFIDTLKAKVFQNFTQTANQGDYLIITQPSIRELGGGMDPVRDYEAYRNSATGGGYNALVVYVEELYDQFAYGIKKHPLGINHFINYALDNFAQQPSHVLMLGKAITSNVATSGTTYANNLVPSYGSPSSDVLLTSKSPNDTRQQVAIGRVSALYPSRAQIYLNKLIEYEAAQNSISQTKADKLWMKRILHFGGGNNIGEQNLFRAFLANYEDYIEAPFYGGNVTSIFKNNTAPIQTATSLLIDSLVTNGVSLITYFGHSSSTTLDFNIDPNTMTNSGKYFIALTNGCLVGSIYDRGFGLSEAFVINADKAAIAYIAPLNFGLANTLNNFSDRFYERLSFSMYGNTVGDIMQSIASELNLQGGLNKLTANQMILHGDPAIKMNTHSEPDYIITDQDVFCEPSVLTTSTERFTMAIVVKNIGKAISGNFDILIRRTFPAGDQEEYTIDNVSAPNFCDTFNIEIIVDSSKGIGENTFEIIIDVNDDIAELSEMNNSVVISKLVLSEDIVPISPDEFCIVNNIPAIYFSLTSKDFEKQSFILEIDTTAYFNSPIKESETIEGEPGVIEWNTQTIPYITNTVYYVRSASKSTPDQTEFNWNNSSFLYNPNLPTGWSQSHYFQFLRDQYITMGIDEEDRQFKFAGDQQSLKIQNGITGIYRTFGNRRLFYNNLGIANSSFIGTSGGLIFFVYDIIEGRNVESFGRTCPTNSSLGTFCDNYPLTSSPAQVIAFNTNNQTWRERAIQFMQNHIPEQHAVLVYTFQKGNFNLWGQDSTVLGTTLFNEFEKLGATKIRQATDTTHYMFYSEKSSLADRTIEVIGKSVDDFIDTTIFFSGVWNEGVVRSTNIGPAVKWRALNLDWKSLDVENYDNFYVNVTGIDSAGNNVLLASEIRDTVYDLSSVDAIQYPQIRLELFAQDDSFRTAPQLQFWRVIHDKLPDAVINPTIQYFVSSDTVGQGQTVDFSVAVTNIGDFDMDSLLVKITFSGPNNNSSIVYDKYPPLLGDSTYNIDFSRVFSGDEFVGLNNIILEVNPDNDQPELFHFNNFAVFEVFVIQDNINPLLDVTFDGKHIVDGDIVASNPEILIRLKDENEFLALNDTSDFSIQLDDLSDADPPKEIYLGQNNVTFVPAEVDNLNNNNEARVYFYPEFLKDGKYELIVQAYDRSDNESGDNKYRITFEVITKTSISNFLNYPNPFTSSTRFVFTVTGAVPDNIRVQILTISGKVVRVIENDELGPISIGQNITEFRWDGTDQYGDPLANGVYLYRVLINDINNDFERFETSIDQFFSKEGFGKMYIAR